MIKNTTLTPHRSLYIPDHSQFALGIIGKYQYTTDNYLGMLGLTFRENLASDALDPAPIYQFMLHLRLQILQLQHANNLFMGSRSATLQMLHTKLNTNIELQQINQLLSQQEISYSNPITRNHSISIQMIDRRLQASKLLSTPAYGRTIHSIQQVTMQRAFRLADLRVPVREREGAQKSTAFYDVVNIKPIYLSNHHSQQWNPLLEKTFNRESNRFTANNFISDKTQTVGFIKSLIQIDPIPPSANQTWNPGKPTIEFRRYSTKLVDTKLLISQGEQTSSSFFFPVEKGFNISNNPFIHQTAVNSSETLNSLYFVDKAATSKLMHSYLKNYNLVFGSSFVQYMVNKLSQTHVEAEQLMATNVLLVDRSLVQRGLSITNEQWNNSLNVSLDNRNTTVENNSINNLQSDLSIHNNLFKRMQPSSAFVQSIIEKQAYSQSETNESYIYNVQTEINENKLSRSTRLQLITRNQRTNVDAARYELTNEQSNHNLFYKRMQESSNFVQSIIEKQAYSQSETNESYIYNVQTEINENKLSQSTRLQLIIRNQSTNVDANINELTNEHNLFYKRMYESTNFVQSLLTKQAYSQQEINSYPKTTEISDNRVNRLSTLQLTVHNSNFEGGSFTKENTINLLQINHILLRNLNNKNDLNKNETSLSSLHFANSQIHKIDNSTLSNRVEFSTKLTLVDRKQHSLETGRNTFIAANRVYLKPNFLYTDVNSQVYQQFRIKLLQFKQVFEALEYPDSPVQLTNRLFTSKIVQAHMSEQNIIMQLNPAILTWQSLANYPIEIFNQNKLSSWVQLNPAIIERQSVLNRNYVDNIQIDLEPPMYTNLNSLQLIERNYSSAALPNNNQALLNSTILQQINQQRNESKFQSFRTSLSPNVYQKFSLTQNSRLLQENNIKRTLIDTQANTFVALINSSNLIEKVVQTHINDWSAQIQYIPITSVNYLLDQVTNEAKTSFNEMNSNSGQIDNQVLTLVERKDSTNNELLIQSVEQDRVSILQQSKEIIQKAIFLKLKTRELQAVNNSLSININPSKPNYESTILNNNNSILRETTLSSGLNPALIQQLWLNSKLVHQTTSHSDNNNFQIQPELVRQIIQERIGDLGQIIQLNSTQVNNQLLLQTNIKVNPLFKSAEPTANLITQATFSNTHLNNLVDRKLIDRGLLHKTLIIRHQQKIQHITDLQSLIQQFQTAPDNLSFALKQLISYTDAQSVENTYNQSHSGPAMSVMTSLSPLIYKKYALQLFNKSLTIKPVKKSLDRVITHRTGISLELATANMETNNLTERLVNERIHALSTLILQMPISSSNLLLHQLNMDIYSKHELEQQIEHTNTQSRLELVDRKIIERGGVSTILTEAYERGFEQIRASEINIKAAVLVSLEKSSIEKTKSLFIQERVHSRNLTENILSKVTNEAQIVSIINNSHKMIMIESNLTNHIHPNLSGQIINERIGEGASVLQLIPDQHENLLFYANHPVMTINHLMEKNTLLFKEKSSLKLIDRKLIDRGLQAAVAVILLKQETKQQAAAMQILAKGSHEALVRSVVGNKQTNKQTAPMLRQMVHQLKDHITELNLSSGPVISYLSSLSPLVYQKFSYHNNSTELTPIQQIKRRLSQSVPQQIKINNSSTMIQRDVVVQANSVNLIYHENLTEKIVRERINEIAHSAQLMTLTNDKQISTQAQMQVITQAQQELEQQLAAVDSMTETTETKARPHLVLVDRNYTDHTMIQTVTDTLLRSGIQERARPEILIDRNHESVIQYRLREAPLTTAFQSAETNVLFRELLTKKVVRAQINDILTQTDHSVTMQSLQKNQINQRFIEKVTSQLLVVNERNVTREHEIRNENNESFERSLTANTESFLVNRRTNHEAAETADEFAALMTQSETTLEYLKTKATSAEPIQQSVANVLNQKEQMVSQSDQTNGKVTPITKLEFDKIVDRVYKELQKRFTYERQRRGM